MGTQTNPDSSTGVNKRGVRQAYRQRPDVEPTTAATRGQHEFVWREVQRGDLSVMTSQGRV